MADVCIECERLWKEYSKAMREYLGLNRPANATGGTPGSGVGSLSVIGPKTESQPALAEMRERILRHEYVAHPEATQPLRAGPRS
jgi:hypothetical protein